MTLDWRERYRRKYPRCILIVFFLAPALFVFLGKIIFEFEIELSTCSFLDIQIGSLMCMLLANG